MPMSPLAGKIAPKEMLIDVEALRKQYFDVEPNPENSTQLVSFGTSGHRGSAPKATFNEAHIHAITQAIVAYRNKESILGPLYLGVDTHALSSVAQRTALEVLAANRIETFLAPEGSFTPTPVISHSILGWNRSRKDWIADGIVITPSHNPPTDGGIKYNPPSAGPAETNVTNWIQNYANDLMRNGNREVKRIPYEAALKAPSTHIHDFLTPYVADLGNVIDMEAIRASGLKIGVDPLGGSSLAYWLPIAEKYGLNIEVVNSALDPTFGFMTVDHDGKIRMDCSSPYAMAGLVSLKDKFDVAFGNDPDADRHGIVSPSSGILNPNHYLAVAINYLFQNRPGWRADSAIGKTVVSSSLIDRVGKEIGRRVSETPVGFKYFVDGLLSGDYGFGGEESAGASFQRLDGTVWTTDKDGLILGLLAAEMTAKTGKDPGMLYEEIVGRLGRPVYTRVDAAATPAQKDRLKRLSPEDVKASSLAGDTITARLTRAPGNGEEIGGLKVVTENGWFAARPSGTEDVYKIYAESFKDEAHLALILEEAKQIVNDAM